MSGIAAKLVGYWRWTSAHIEFADGAPNVDIYGGAPEGGVVFTPGGRMMVIITSAGRLPAETDTDRAALFRSVAAYTGQFRLEEGGRFVTKVDATWDPAWAGIQERFFSIEGDTFTVRTARQTHPSFPGRDLWIIGVAQKFSE
jgi:hypothetical protein